MRVRYECVTCRRTVESDAVIYECPSCAAQSVGARPDRGYPRGYLSVVFTPARRVRLGEPVEPLTLLPLPITGARAFTAGGTPLVEPTRLRASSDFKNLYLKNDTLNPSGSLKDRASLLVAEQALALGEKRAALASTGNAGASMACAGAAYGLSIVLFVPAAAPRAKLLQSLLYAARVVPVQGTYDEAFALSIEYTRRCGGINRNTGFNPFTVEGKKTVSIEMYNQLGGRAPDVVYVPTGDGVIISGAYKGFADLQALGATETMPTLVAVQAEGSNAISRALREGGEPVLGGTSTIADSLSVSRPAAGAMATIWMRRHGGRAVEVSDAEIGAAQAALAREAGLFVEPSSAAAWAGFLKDAPKLDPLATVVVLLTGTGFKDTAAAEKLVRMPAPCKADLESALKLLADSYGLKE
jgi:threonine synthase